MRCFSMGRKIDFFLIEDMHCMGRYYHGDIGGKFWFGIQESDDASFFGREHDDIYIFCVCACALSEEDTRDPKLYCDGCYSSYEEHMQAKTEESGEKEKDEGETVSHTWQISPYEIQYNYQESDLPIVIAKVNELEALVGQYMEGYRIVQDEYEFEYEYTLPSNVPNIALLARLCLGRQLLHCLQTTGSCSFNAEV